LARKAKGGRLFDVRLDGRVHWKLEKIIEIKACLIEFNLSLRETNN
jgi:hypothetical protein